MRDKGTGPPKQFGIELQWSANELAGAYLSAPIVRGSPYTTVRTPSHCAQLSQGNPPPFAPRVTYTIEEGKRACRGLVIRITLVKFEN